MTWPRIFILGAGFARPAGLPLSASLLDLVLGELATLNGRKTHLHWSLGDYLDYNGRPLGPVPSPSISKTSLHFSIVSTFRNLGTRDIARSSSRRCGEEP